MLLIGVKKTFTRAVADARLVINLIDPADHLIDPKQPMKISSVIVLTFIDANFFRIVRAPSEQMIECFTLSCTADMSSGSWITAVETALDMDVLSEEQKRRAFQAVRRFLCRCSDKSELKIEGEFNDGDELGVEPGQADMEAFLKAMDQDDLTTDPIFEALKFHFPTCGF